ncbi:hypothetical protein J7M28_08120 [bacterium]|nr:hypothetical protein [bacterium]
MRCATIFVMTVFIIVSVAASAIATDYFVDCNTGNDSNSGLSSDEAWETMEHAVENAHGTEADPGVIHIGRGGYGDPHYSPPFYHYQRLSVPEWIWLRGEGSRRPYLAYHVYFTLGCTTVIENLSAVTVSMVGGQSMDTNVTIRNCALNGFSLSAGTTGPFKVAVEISQCSFTGWSQGGGGITVSGGQGPLELAIRSTHLIGIESFEGYPSTPYPSRWLQFGDLDHISATPQIDRLVVENCAFVGTSYCSEQVYVWLQPGWSRSCEAEISNCLFGFTECHTGAWGDGPLVPERCLWMERAEVRAM